MGKRAWEGDDAASEISRQTPRVEVENGEEKKAQISLSFSPLLSASSSSFCACRSVLYLMEGPPPRQTSCSSPVVSTRTDLGQLLNSAPHRDNPGLSGADRDMEDEGGSSKKISSAYCDRRLVICLSFLEVIKRGRGMEHTRGFSCENKIRYATALC